GCGDSQPADSELIDASLMRLDDLPTKQDWKIDRSADADDATSKKFAAEIDECEAEGDPTLDKGFPEGESEDFVRLEIRDDDFVTANSSSEVVDDAKLREKFMDGIDPLVG